MPEDRKIPEFLEPGSLKTPDGLTPESAADWLKTNGVRQVLAQFVDIHGVPKAKAVPLPHFNDILTDGAGFAGAGFWGSAMQPHHPEYMMKGDLSSLRLTPWIPGYASMFGTGLVQDAPHRADTRNLLVAQMARLADSGMVLNTGLEPEFMLLNRAEDGTVRPFDRTDTQEKAAYDYRGLMRARSVLGTLVECLDAVGFDVYQIDHEDANGQYEVNFHYADALTTADNITFFKMAASEIAQANGAICSFMPKPFSRSTGNGMHIHFSLADESGSNLFSDSADPNGLALSQLAYHFLGGVLDHAAALTALLCPTVNSYKRLVIGNDASGTNWAPVFVSYGDNNRTAMVRAPGGRLEIRVGDSAMNPYLATAALIAAGMDGIERKLEPGKPQNVNFYDLTGEQLSDMGVQVLPQSLQAALDALRADSLFADTLGAEIVDEFTSIKQAEWDSYHRHVSEWELDRYLTFF